MLGLDKEIWEGWTARDFIRELEPEIDMIMKGHAWKKPFQNKAELAEYCRVHQPYYKKTIPAVVNHFAKKYRLK